MKHESNIARKMIRENRAEIAAQQERKPSFIQERAQLEQEWCELRNLKRDAQQERRLSGRDRDDLLNLIATADCDADVMISDGKAGGQLSKGWSIKRGIEIVRQFIKETP